MVILDTNVVSEVMKAGADQRVQDWLGKQAEDSLYITTITVSELLRGTGLLPESRKKVVLGAALDLVLTEFEDRILAFDLEAAKHHATIAVATRATGKTLPIADGYIAAIAASYGFAVASRDTGPFRSAGVAVINPWLAEATDHNEGIS